MDGRTIECVVTVDGGQLGPTERIVIPADKQCEKLSNGAQIGRRRVTVEFFFDPPIYGDR